MHRFKLFVVMMQLPRDRFLVPYWIGYFHSVGIFRCLDLLSGCLEKVQNWVYILVGVNW